MDIQIQITITQSDEEHVETLISIDKGNLQPESLGLTRSEAQQVLVLLQDAIVSQQVATFNQDHCLCPDCGTPRPKKDTKFLTYRTLFGKLELESPRYYTCDCQPRDTKSESPLTHRLPERSSPELLYLQTKWASLMSYGMTTELLNDVLPVDVATSSVSNQVQQLAQRAEEEMEEEQVMFIDGCPADWEQLPEPDGRLVVGIDGGYIKARDGNNRKAGWFEAIVGKSIPDKGDNKCFGFVTTYDKKPKRRLYDMLQSQGLQNNQNVTFLSDGGDTVRNLQMYLSPQAEHVLDWFHITMRITVMRQMAKSLPNGVDDLLTAEQADQRLESAKWYLWHGNPYMALERLDWLYDDIECFTENEPRWQKLFVKVDEFMTYIRNNYANIPNYDERYTYGETISTAFVESTVNQVISKRFVKKQQMRWTKQGAHLLLQMRTRVLNNDLQSLFQCWYPNMNVEDVKVHIANVA